MDRSHDLRVTRESQVEGPTFNRREHRFGSLAGVKLFKSSPLCYLWNLALFVLLHRLHLKINIHQRKTFFLSSFLPIRFWMVCSFFLRFPKLFFLSLPFYFVQFSWICSLFVYLFISLHFYMVQLPQISFFLFSFFLSFFLSFHFYMVKYPPISFFLSFFFLPFFLYIELFPKISFFLSITFSSFYFVLLEDDHIS